ncbi:MAG TPA: hypothetical protein VNZ47_11835 [Candidatus Dormibacteraeota bacterium]|jgi:hypothetical protein|nr:hypothetical protein [Candidatus Dormibacteraeota bacterium]
MTDREKLPNVRGGQAIDFEWMGHQFTGRGNFYPDGRLAEIFISGGKTGTHMQITMQDAAVAASLALQHGCDAQTLRRACLRTEDDKPAGPMGMLLEKLAEGQPREI